MTAVGTRAHIGVLSWVLVATAIVGIAGCAGRGARTRDATETGTASSGLYRVTVRDPVDGQRRFRLLLFAELPDRLHGEILSPVGSVVMVFDGGHDRMAVTFARDRVSFAGQAREEALEKVFGVRMSLHGLVRGLLTDEVAPDGLEVTREAAGSPALPSRLVLDDGRRSLTLELKRMQPLRAAPSALGRGEPPEGMEVRPLSELVLYDTAELLPGGTGAPRR